MHETLLRGVNGQMSEGFKQCISEQVVLTSWVGCSAPEPSMLLLLHIIAAYTVADLLHWKCSSTLLSNSWLSLELGGRRMQLELSTFTSKTPLYGFRHSDVWKFSTPICLWCFCSVQRCHSPLCGKVPSCGFYRYLLGNHLHRGMDTCNVGDCLRKVLSTHKSCWFHLNHLNIVIDWIVYRPLHGQTCFSLTVNLFKLLVNSLMLAKPVSRV